MNYYTYAYLREDGTPYYIGKGKGNRIHSKSNRVFNPPPKERRIFLKKNLTEDQAFSHEIYMIDVFGRKDLGTGILHNKSDGGIGGGAGFSNFATADFSTIGGGFNNRASGCASAILGGQANDMNNNE